MLRDIPVFDRGHTPPVQLINAATLPDLPADEVLGIRQRAMAERQAARERVKVKVAIETARTSIIKRGIAIHQSAGQLERHLEHANDNRDWPLAKFLRTERRFAALMVAERYRKLHDTATNDSILSGKTYGGELEAGRQTKLDESTGELADKGERLSKGIARDVTALPGGAVPAKKWQGDNAINSRIDAIRELAILRGKMGKCLHYFELAVVGNATLEEVGNEYGIRNEKGATGSGRALVDIGLDNAARHWRVDLSVDDKLLVAA
jgi:hypothetical protein